MGSQIQQYKEKLNQFLRQENRFTDLLAIAESKTGTPRLYLFLGFVGFFALYLIFGYGAQLLCNIVGFVYPAYASVKAIQSRDKEDDTQWLMYWVVFALFSVVEFFSDILLSWFPFYWLAKCIFLVWCFSPVPWNGSHMIYNRIILPVFNKHHDKFDAVLAKASDKISTLAGKAGESVKAAVHSGLKKED